MLQDGAAVRIKTRGGGGGGVLPYKKKPKITAARVVSIPFRGLRVACSKVIAQGCRSEKCICASYIYNFLLLKWYIPLRGGNEFATRP